MSSAPRSAKRSMLVVAAAVMGSRLMGLIREQVFAFMFGASKLSDVFLAAFRIPNLLRDLFAEGALSTAFTTTFTKLWEKEGAEAAWRLASVLISTLILILGAICILGMIFAPEVVMMTNPGFNFMPGKLDLAARMTEILFPFIMMVSLAAVVMGMLNARNIFGLPASASTLFNIVSIISGLGLAIYFDPQKDLLHPHFGKHALYGWCIGVLIGGMAQLSVQIPSLWNLGYRFAWRIDFKDPALRNVLALMIPSAIAGSAVQINVLVNSAFASYINGAGSWLYYAFRLVQLPIGIFGVAIATVTLPAVARQHARDDLAAFGRTVEEALRFGFYLTLPASMGLTVMARPIIQLIYEHGKFTAYQTNQTALALQAYAIGLAGYSGIKILVPCFYALDEPKTPPVVSFIGMGMNVVLNFIFYFYLGLGHVGLAFTTGFVAVANFLQLIFALQKKISLGRARHWFDYFIRVSAATYACGGVAYLGDHTLLAHLSSHTALGAAYLFLIMIASALVYFGLTVLFGLPESMELVNFLKRKLGKVEAAAPLS